MWIIKPPKKRKFSYKSKDLPVLICPLCNSPTICLRINGFCSCIATRDDYESVIHEVSSKKKIRLILKKNNFNLLKQRYNNKLESKNLHLIKLSTRNNNLKKSKLEFYNSREWKELRYRILKDYGAKCQLCGNTSKESPICVDHIKPLHENWELRLCVNNLQVLCKNCNEGKSNIDYTDFRK